MSSSDESNTSGTRKSGKSEPEKIVVSKRSSPRKRRPEFKESSSSSETSSPLTSPEMAKKTFEPIPSTSYAPDPYSNPKSKTVVDPVPSTSNAPDSYHSPSTSHAGQEENPEEIVISPKVMHYFLNSYKDSPDYRDLKRKRFNTSFLHEIPRGDRDIQIFTPEEDNSPFYTENLPVIKNKIRGVPGEKYAATFKSIPGLSPVTSDEEVKSKLKGKAKRGRKPAIGYKGVPLPDDNLLVDYTNLYDSDSFSCYPFSTDEEESCSSCKGKATKDKSSILLSLLSARPNKKAVRRYLKKSRASVASKKTARASVASKKTARAAVASKKTARAAVASNKTGSQVIVSRNEKAGSCLSCQRDQMYKPVFGGRTLRVMLERLPVDSLQQVITKKKPKSAVASKGKKCAAIKCTLLPHEKAINGRVLRVCVSKLKLPTKKYGSTID